MKPIQDKYPLFASNQVLTSHHLNQIFDYLNEQERLTRANLIGIGIECGLEIKPETNPGGQIIHLSKGCGVSSAGYLLVEPEEVALVSYRSYTLPAAVDYPQFKYESAGKMTQVLLWEMFPDGEPDTTLLGKEKDFLDNKAVILFLELKKEGLRNCSASNCDDKGDEVTATVRRLLIGISDLTKIIIKANELGTEYTATDLESVLFARLNLPDLRLPRYDVLNTGPISSNDLLAAFHAVFQKNKLSATTGKALSAAYQAFKPLLNEIYPADPFGDFNKKFGFLDAVPTSTSQVRFLQYYFDLFDDLIQAYDEFRRKGTGLMCACCPPEELFPRHLMLGLPNQSAVSNPGIYRHDFLLSPAIKGCGERRAEVLQLFQRLVEMVNHFTNNPTPPDFLNKEVARKFIPVRITPSKLANIPISGKAIPYYYLQNGNPPLFRLWNVEKTRHNRANHNLSFRSDEYLPAAPVFVTKPLQYDLEPYNFLRIEGHLGKDVKGVMNTLLAYKTSYRLPIGIIALRTGAFDARIPIDLTKESCRFEDLEALFDALRDEFISALGKTLASFYKRKVSKEVLINEPIKTSLIHSFNRDAVVEPSTFGAMLELHYAATRKTSTDLSLKKYTRFNIKDAFIGESAVIQATASYAEILLDICNYLKNRLLSEFSLTEFRDLFNQLEFLNAQFRKQVDTTGNEWNELFNLLEAVRYASQMEAFRSIGEEYAKRLIEVKKKLFLSNFLQNNPGIQHKAGVPLGGTFIVVYHDDPTPLRFRTGTPANLGSLKANFSKAGFAAESASAISKAFVQLQEKSEMAQIDPDIKLIISEMSKEISRADFGFEKGIREKTAEKIIAETVNEFADGTVIADFYLPYICCSDCSPIQYIIPKDPLNFSVTTGCPNPDDRAKITVTPVGGTAPYKIKINAADFVGLKEEFLLTAGTYTLILRDSEGTDSPPQQIVIPAHLSLGEPGYDCIGDGKYIAVIAVSGGTAPYKSDHGEFQNNNFISSALPDKKEIEIIITDSRNCSASVSVNHSCGPDLAFTAKVGCTSPKNLADVELLPTGGIAPYEFKVGTGPFAALSGTVALPVGVNSVSVRDAAGAIVALDITIPPTLILTIAEFMCDPASNTWQARIQVSGGIAPYDSDKGKKSADNEFITNLIPSGEAIMFEVFDSRKCNSAIEVKHTCDEPCKLPCEGQSRKCAYRLWLQPASKESVYEIYQQLKDLRFRFNGQIIKLPVSTDLLQIQVDALNKDFEKVMTKTVGRLNEVIQKVLIEKFGDIGKSRLELTYEPSADDPFGILWIEYFVCETFNFEFEYKVAKGGQSFNLQFRMTNEPDDSGKPFNGTITVDPETRTTANIPAFDCRERNQCKGSDYVKLCTNSGLKPELIIEPSGNNSFVFVCTSKDKNVVAFVWDVMNTAANEPFYTGRRAQAFVPKPNGNVRLTVINNNGCFAIAEKQF